MRGVMVALFAYWVNIGSIVGAVVDNKTKERLDALSYRIPLACLYIVPTLLFVALFFVPESPRWLLHRGKEGEARRALEQLRGGSYATILAESGDEGSVVPTLLDVEWVEMVKGVEEEKREQGSVSALDMFRGKIFPLSNPSIFNQQVSGSCLYSHTYTIRPRSPPHAPLLRHDRLPNRLRRVVPNRLSNILLHRLRHNQSFRILHNEHLLRLPRRQRRHVRHQRTARSTIHPHARCHRLWPMPTSHRRCSHGESEYVADRSDAGSVYRAVYVLL